MIRLEGVDKAYPAPGGGTAPALLGLDLMVARGEFLCLVGSSGSGKSTTLRMVNGLERPDRGVVEVDGRPVQGSREDDSELVDLRRKVGMVVQSGALFPHLTVQENVALPGRAAGWDEGRRAERADELLELMRLPARSFSARPIHALSGGQRQRVGVARALFLDPPIVLLDEPFGALDPITRVDLGEEFGAMWRELGKTILFVTHDIEEAFALGDRVGLMHEGRLVQCGTPEDLRDRPADDFVARFVGGRG